jgi:hypothetical protein
MDQLRLDGEVRVGGEQVNVDERAVWGSVITSDLVDGWTGEEIAALVADLDNAVMQIVTDHEGQRAK